MSPPSYQEDEPPAYDALTVTHASKEKRHQGRFDEDYSESPSKCLSTGLSRFNDEAMQSPNQTTTLQDIDRQFPTPLILVSNLRHHADSAHHAPNEIRSGRHAVESNNIEAPNDRLLIGGRQKNQPSGVLREQPFTDRKQDISLQGGENQCCSISLQVSSLTRNKCQSETESDAFSGDDYQLVSDDCVSMASATIATDSEDEVRSSLMFYANRCR